VIFISPGYFCLLTTWGLLSVRSVTVKADDEKFELKGFNFKRDHSGGSIWEWMDEPIKENLSMLRTILDSSKVVIRFHGDKYNSDFTLPNSQKLAMREIYDAWRQFGGGK
jgi:hypothetical protein